MLTCYFAPETKSHPYEEDKVMSSSWLLCRFSMLSILLLAPTYSQAQDQVWVDIAVALWRDGSGRAHVAAGYSGGQPIGQLASVVALQQCEAQGGRGCENKGPWRGCAYVTVGRIPNGVAWGIGGSPEAAIASIRSVGATTWKPPIGGCGR